MHMASSSKKKRRQQPSSVCKTVHDPDYRKIPPLEWVSLIISTLANRDRCDQSGWKMVRLHEHGA